MTQDQIRASFQIKENSITPNLIDYSGSTPTDEQSLVYDAGADKFKWTTISGSIGDHTHTVLPSVTVSGTLDVVNNVVINSGLAEIFGVDDYDNGYQYMRIRQNPAPSYSSFLILESEVDDQPGSVIIRATKPNVATTSITLSAYPAGTKQISIVSDITNITGPVKLKSTDLTPTDSSNDGVIYVQSGVLKFRDQNGTVYTVDLTPV